MKVRDIVNLFGQNDKSKIKIVDNTTGNTLFFDRVDYLQYTEDGVMDQLCKYTVEGLINGINSVISRPEPSEISRGIPCHLEIYVNAKEKITPPSDTWCYREHQEIVTIGELFELYKSQIITNPRQPLYGDTLFVEIPTAYPDIEWSDIQFVTMTARFGFNKRGFGCMVSFDYDDTFEPIGGGESTTVTRHYQSSLFNANSIVESLDMNDARTIQQILIDPNRMRFVQESILRIRLTDRTREEL